VRRPPLVKDTIGELLLQKIRAADSDICVICMTALPSVDVAVRTLKSQAFDYLQKPLAMEELRADPGPEARDALPFFLVL